MSLQEITTAVMELPERDRLDIARRAVATIAQREVDKAIAAAIPGIEDVVTGKVKGLTEEEFRERIFVA